MFSTPTVAGDLVYIGSCAGVYYGLEAWTGKVRWSQGSARDWSMRQPLVLGNAVLAGSEAGELSAFRLSDGAVEWTHQFKGTIRSIGNSGSVLYVGTLNGTVYAYDTAGLWR